MNIKNTVIKSAEQEFYNCLVYFDKLNIDIYSEDSEDNLAAYMANYDYSSAYEVIDPLEAFEICGSHDFPSVDDIDFSTCHNALDCCLHEANKAIQPTLEKGWTIAFNEVSEMVEHFKELAMYMNAPGVISIHFSTAPRLSHMIHNMEHPANILIYDDHASGVYPKKIDGKDYGMEKKLSNQCYMFCMFEPTNSDSLEKPQFIEG